jgi:hypothetical protein
MAYTFGPDKISLDCPYNDPTHVAKMPNFLTPQYFIKKEIDLVDSGNISGPTPPPNVTSRQPPPSSDK